MPTCFMVGSTFKIVHVFQGKSILRKFIIHIEPKQSLITVILYIIITVSPANTCGFMYTKKSL